MKRRGFLYLLALSAAGGAWAWQSQVASGQAEEAVLRLQGRLTGRPLDFLTPAADLYVTSISQPPAWDAGTFRLHLAGAVATPLQLDLDGLRAGPAVTRTRTLECIGNRPGGRSIGNCQWTGILLRDLLARAEPRPAAVEVVFHCMDGYTESMPLAVALQGEPLLAWEVNGAPLPPEHGAPLRVIWPGRFGMKNPKWVSRVELREEPYSGYWPARGWSEDARALLISGFHWPPPGAALPSEPLLLHGYAYGGDAAIAAVEVQVDGEWREARLSSTPAPFVWTLWDFPWTPPGPGRYALAVRARSSSERQDERTSASASQGNTGLHRITVAVSAGSSDRTS